MIISIILAAIGGLLYGYNTAVIAGVMLYLKDAFALSTTMQGWTVGILLLGALFAAWIAGRLADWAGRKKTILFSSLCFVAGCFLAASADSLAAFSIGRWITGMGLGFVSVICPMYLSEVSSAKVRGTTVTIYPVGIALGILCAYLANYSFASSGSWRLMILLGSTGAILQILLSPFLLESPRWLMAKGNEVKAHQVARRFGVRQFKEVVPTRKSRFKDLFASRSLRMAVLVGLFMSIFQQITGINAILYFAPQIFQLSGFSGAQSSTLATLGLGIINLLATILALWLLDRAGRRILLLIGSLGMCFSLICTAISFFDHFRFSDYFSILGLMSYVGFFSIGLGPIVWVVIAEIYPLAIRGKAMSLAIFANWLVNYLVSLSFLDLVAKMGTAAVFFIFAILSLICFFFVFKLLPETKGRELEEIKKLF